IGVVIFILSLYACMRAVQFCLAFRRSKMMPQDTYREVSQLIELGRLRQAIQCCDDDGSAYARIVSAAIGQADGGWSAVEQAAQDALTEEAAGMYRHVEVLSVVGNIAPMLGLLGTVLGMVIAFGELATSDGLAKNLAQGIYFALVTTVDGLLVAIPALLAFSFFNNRVAVLTAELTHRVEGTLRPLRRGTPPLPGPRGPVPGGKVSGLQELK
ncbi:MAG: MotA/TolQ/ExbB proton channel family protein, partial [Thermoguttaceae bacterium]|nr:MotA/TolQ/ExbB proton channel family protein [Thermoguttaceae bacterium]